MDGLCIGGRGMCECRWSENVGDGNELDKPEAAKFVLSDLHGRKGVVAAQKSIARFGHRRRAEIGWVVCRRTAADKRGFTAMEYSGG